MVELFLLMIFNLLYPDKNKANSSKDDMNTAVAFFTALPLSSLEKNRTIKRMLHHRNSPCPGISTIVMTGWIGNQSVCDRLERLT
jgi:hypothetical protein